MDERNKIKKYQSNSQINGTIGRVNNSKYSRGSNTSKQKICKRKNKSELKLQTTYQKFLPNLGLDTYDNESYLKNEDIKVINKIKASTITMGFYSNKSSEELQKTLFFNKNRMLKNKTELNELKINYNKLSEHNRNNKNILSKILNLKENRQYSKEELLQKIKTCEFDGQSKRRMLDSIELINLKLEVNEKRSILKSKNNEYNLLKENSKYKNISELKKRLVNNDEIKKQLLLDIDKLKQIVLKGKQAMKESEQENINLDEKYKKVRKEEDEIKQKINEFQKKSDTLQDEIVKIERKLQKQEIIYKQNYKIQFEMKNSIKVKEKQIKEINDYLSKREQINSDILKRKEIIKQYEDKNFELDTEYDKLNNENNELIKKNTELEIESNKNKMKLKDIKNGKNKNKLKECEDNLKKIKLDFDSIKKEYENKKKKYDDKKNKQKEMIQKNKEEIDKKNAEIDKLEKKKEELETNIKNARLNINEIQKELNNRKKQMELIKQQHNIQGYNCHENNDEQLKNENDK